MFYAKSVNKVTIRYHTDCLLKNYNTLKKAYYKKNYIMNDRLWELLRIAVEYHDLGKANTIFQNKMRKKLNLPLLETINQNDIPHNILSILLVPYKKLGLNDKERKLLIHAIGYHHERDDVVLDKDFKKRIKETIKEDVINKMDKLADHMNLILTDKILYRPLDILRSRYTPRGTSEDMELFYQYVMLKGLLHRLDHAASANVDIERCLEENISSYVNNFIKNTLKSEKNKLQSFTEKNSDKHVIVIAQTGMGKTEAGLLWIDKEKGFFTLPLRVSINAMYERIKDTEGIGFLEKDGALGLLHSSSLDYLEGKNQDDENNEVYFERSRHFSNRLLITTIDQILKFPFYYRGFEKELSTLSGAKIVIDELQSYNPKIAALIIRALEMIDAVGGRFLIMTATLPKLYLDKIINSENITRFPLVHKKFVDDSLKRHNIKLIDNSILSNINELIKASKHKKVLVICNTVNRAVEVYRKVSKEVNANLLHALYIQKHRFILENRIKQFANSSEKGIWITTQLVEASLDIDFDVLYTEMSILDSFFQRMGRCYRKRSLNQNSPNVYVFTEDVSGEGAIYNKKLLNNSLELLKKYNNKTLLESEKMKLIEILYNEKNLPTEYLDIFNNTLNFLYEMEPYDINKKEAQKYLRDINNIKIIPRNIFNEINDNLIQNYKKNKCRKLRRQIEMYTISINYHRVKNLISKNELPNTLHEIAIANLDYEFNDNTNTGTGLNLKPCLVDFL